MNSICSHIHNNLIKLQVVACLSVVSLLLISCQTKTDDISKLEQGFAQIPDSINLGVYWYWISDHISKEGVIKDLEAMKSLGIGRAFIGNIQNEGTPPGPVPFLSDQWWEITHAACKRATELGIELGMFNSPGWSQSGGPWIKTEESMRYLLSKELEVVGGKELRIVLKKPSNDFQPVKVIAYPKPKGAESAITYKNARISSTPRIKEIASAFDGDSKTAFFLAKNRRFTLNMQTNEPTAARSLLITTNKNGCRFKCLLSAHVEGDYKPIKEFLFDRTNNMQAVGFDPLAPVVVTFPVVSVKEFRLEFFEITPNSSIAEIVLTGSAIGERFPEKQLAKMFQSPLPMWGDYMWERQVDIDDKTTLISLDEVIDLSPFMQNDSLLVWNAPAGEWTIQQCGMVTTGVTNGPATPEATGLEVDKLSRKHVAKHFNSYIGEILRRIPEKDRESFKVVVQDSYETGSQNWTDGFDSLFMKRYGYDPLPFLPAFTGKVVQSPDITDRFFWDLRRLIADKLSYDYVGGLRNISNQHGLTTWLECYGHWGFPGEFLQYGGQSDEVAGEFWNEGTLGDIECRAAASCAHIYNKKRVWAESFTASGKDFERTPAMLKRRGDWSFTEGVNATLLHLYICQPYEDKDPGVNAWFSTEFNRKNTLFPYMKSYFDYLRRCNFLLQQGNPVNDIAYFIGEDAPKMTGETHPSVPKGYSFDYINSEVILNNLSVKNGKWVLPHGVSYSILVLPNQQTIRPEVLEKITALVKDGGVLYGAPLTNSPSLENYPKADSRVLSLSQELFGSSKTEKERFVGLGRVFTQSSLEEVFVLIGLKPDCIFEEGSNALYSHRSLKEGEIYFISNQSNEKRTLLPCFRVEGKQPELWDPVTGTTRVLPSYSSSRGSTTLPIRLEEYESCFIIFRKEALSPNTLSVEENHPPTTLLADITTNNWTIHFNDTVRAPQCTITTSNLFDWSSSTYDPIRYYSGVATYRTTFHLDKMPDSADEKLFLNLGKVASMAKLFVNEKEVLTLWTAPYSANVTPFIQQGENSLRIEVVNTWINRLIGDASLPEKRRTTWTIHDTKPKERPLQESGLKGPVTLIKVTY